MQHNRANINLQERTEAIIARLNFVVARMYNPSFSEVAILPTTGKKIDFASHKNNWSLSRLIWKIGELHINECLSNLLLVKPLLSKEIEYYSFVWTLGRIGTAAQVTEIRSILDTKKDFETVVAVSYQSLFLLLPEGNEKEELKAFFTPYVPNKVTAAINSQQYEAIEENIIKSLTKDRVNSWLFWLYLQQRENKLVQKALLSVLQSIPMEGNYFYAVRKIVKAAEHFEDMEMMALLYWRIYSSEAKHKVYSPVKWERVNGTWKRKTGKKRVSYQGPNGYVSDELHVEVKKENSNFGFTGKTKIYFERKFLRALLNSGQSQSENFTKLATAYLLLADDTTAKNAFEETIGKHVYDRATRRWNYFTNKLHYPQHWDNFPLHQLLHSNIAAIEIDTKNKGVRSQKPLQTLTNTQRAELFPDLWNEAPKSIIQLLGNSNAELVQDFARRVFMANPAFATIVSPEDIVQFLDGPFEKTQRLAMQIVQEDYKRFAAHKSIFVALLDCPFAEAEIMAFTWMNKHKTELLSDNTFLLHLLLHPKKSVQNWFKNALSSSNFAEERRYEFYAYILHFLLEQNPVTPAVFTPIFNCIKSILAEEARQTPANLLAIFVTHASPELPLLGAYLMKNNRKKVTKMPYEWILHLLENEHPTVRAAGIELLGLLPMDVLYQKQVIVANFCVSPIEEVRTAAKSIVLQLSSEYPDFGTALTETLADFLLMRGKTTEVLDFIGELLTENTLLPHLKNLKTKLVWQLLNSKKYAAQRIGFAALQTQNNAANIDLDVAVTLSKHELKTAREWAFEAIRQQTPKAVYEADKVLRMLESDWEDSRLFMMDFAEKQLQARDWTPALLVSLCDSTREEIQAFGVTMIERYFKEEHATQFLLQLSQHPTARIQLLAAKWLEQYAGGKPKIIRQLKDFFVTLLSQINKGRVAKNHAFDFLAKEAEKSVEVAEMVLPILERIVLTVAIGDKATCILLLHKLRKKYPHLKRGDAEFAEVSQSAQN